MRSTQVSIVLSIRSVNYLEDEVASAFFEARESEAFISSLKLVDERRSYYDEHRQKLLKVLKIANSNKRAQLEELVIRAGHNNRNRSSGVNTEDALELVRRVEPIGIRLLGENAGIDLKHLRDAYRAAVLKHHPDRGGAHEDMIAINRAFEQLHCILLSGSLKEIDTVPRSRFNEERGEYETEYEDGNICYSYWDYLALDELSNISAYLWSINHSLFSMALDEWDLEDALEHIKAMYSDRQRCSESRGARLIDLIEDSCKLTERLAASGRLHSAQVSLAVALEGLKAARKNGMNFESCVQQARDTIAGKHRPRFVLNSTKQIENAFRLGAIDRNRYQANLARVANRRKQKEDDRLKRLAILEGKKFLQTLPIDVGLSLSSFVKSLIPQPNYFELHVENLSSDQQAEYLSAFRDGRDLDKIAKYAFVRLSSLLRSAIFHFAACDLKVLLEEAMLLAQLEPRCSMSADGVGEIIRILMSLKGKKLKDYAASLATLLNPKPQKHGEILVVFSPDLERDLMPDFFQSAIALAKKYGVR